jgi:geranylgeranylglycerol-phosphate geranylgeranyltransferase
VSGVTQRVGSRTSALSFHALGPGVQSGSAMQKKHAVLSGFVGLVLLARPVNVIIVVASVLLGSYLSGTLVSLRVLFACLSAALVLAAGNAMNDVCDLEIDLINDPSRPIPSGKITRRGASLLFAVLFLAGISVSCFLGAAGLSIAVASTLLLVFYSLWLKRRILVGNLTVSLLGSMAFLYGGVAAMNPRGAVYPALFAFLFHLGREIVKDVEDVVGDRIGRARTLPVVMGERAGIVAAACVFGVLILSTLIPFLTGAYGLFYLLAVLLGADSAVGLVAVSLLTRRPWMRLSTASGLLKVGMVFGLGALALGRF